MSRIARRVDLEDALAAARKSVGIYEVALAGVLRGDVVAVERAYDAPSGTVWTLRLVRPAAADGGVLVVTTGTRGTGRQSPDVSVYYLDEYSDVRRRSWPFALANAYDRLVVTRNRLAAAADAARKG